MLALLLTLLASAAAGPPTPGLELVAQAGHAPQAHVQAVALSETLVLSYAEDAAILWDREGGQELRRTPALTEGNAWTSWQLSPDEARLVGFTAKGGAALFDPLTLDERARGPARTPEGRPPQPCLDPRLSEDGAWVLCPQASGLRIFRVDDPREQLVLGGPEEAEDRGLRWLPRPELEGLPRDAHGDPVLTLDEGPFVMRSLARPLALAGVRLEGDTLVATLDDGRELSLDLGTGALRSAPGPAAPSGSGTRWTADGRTWIHDAPPEGPETLTDAADGAPVLRPWPRSAWRPQTMFLLHADPAAGSLWLSRVNRPGLCALSVAHPWRKRCGGRERALVLGAEVLVADDGVLIGMTEPAGDPGEGALLSAWAPGDDTWTLLGAEDAAWLHAQRFARLQLSGDLVAVFGATETHLYSRATGALEARLAKGDARWLSVDPRAYVTAHADGQLHLWSREDGALLATLLLLEDGWVAVDPEGRLDRSANEPQGLYWVLDAAGQRSALSLDQLERYYFEPRLVLKHLSQDPKPRDVVGFDPSKLPPRLRWTRAGDTLQVTLEDRGAGLGRVALYVNGVEVDDDVRGDAGAAFEVDLAAYQRFMVGGGRDDLRLEAWSADDHLSSRGPARFTAALFEDRPVDDVDVFALVIGTHTYADPALDLRFPDDDAEALRRALEAGGAALFGEAGKTHVTLLSTGPGEQPPTLEAIEAAVADIAAQSDPWDVLVVYLSGHGVTRDGRYYYPLPDATREDLLDPDLLDARSLSQPALLALLRSVPANKTFLILDTCESGAFITGARSELTSDDQRRALEELKDRMGVVILAGAPASRSAYERPELAHGLLTYALLEGMRGGALDEDL
ncbi:MAG: caspase family protein, partial [Alphaproteobacteria bacterium]|nr:caspase family protein [Alphaproteobacteria bacterium]